MTATTVLQAKWDAIRKDADPLRWLIAKANDKGNELQLVEAGDSGFAEFVKVLGETRGIVQAGIRIAAVDVRGSVRSVRFKFIRVVMITDDVSAMKRARAANVKAAADEIFHGTHATFDISNVEELTQDVIVTKLHNSAGAHQPNHYEFEAIDGELSPVRSGPKTAAATNATSKDVEENEPPGSGATSPANSEEGREHSADTAASPDSKAVVSATAGGTPREDVSIPNAWRRVLDDRESINWLVATFDGKDPRTATLVRAASGDLESFKAAFDDSKVMFGAFRCSAIDNSGSVKSVRAKLIFFSWIGSRVSGLARAKAGSARGYFEDMMSGTHISINASDVDDIDEGDLVQRLQQCAGAHKPNAYDFSGKKRPEDF